MKPTIEIEESVELGMGVEKAWGLLTDPNVVVSCVPGAELTGEEDEDGALEGSLSLSLGPTTTRFSGKITPQFDPAEHTGTLKGQGSDGRGKTRASIDTTFALTPIPGDPERSHLAIQSAMAVKGALAGFAATGGQAVARRLLQDFAENLAALHGTEEGQDQAPTPPRRRLGVLGLLVRTVRDALSRIFSRTKNSKQSEDR